MTIVTSNAKRCAPLIRFDRRDSPAEPFPTIVELCPRDADRLAELASRITACARYDTEASLNQARDLSRQVPDPVFEALSTFHPVGAVLLQHLRVGPLPQTPRDNSQGLARHSLLAKQQLIMSSLLGDPICYEAEGHGHLVQDMVPNRKLAFTQSSQGSEVELESHTEQAFSPFRPDVVTLAALRGDLSAATYLLPASALLENLPAADVERLCQPRWTFEIDESFRASVPDPDEMRGPWPILCRDANDPDALAMTIDLDMAWGISRRDQELLERLVPLYRRHRQAIVLRAGDVLFFDNRTNMHGRSPFSPRYDGRDRWVSRGFITRDLARSASARPGGGRVVAARFS